MTTLAETPSAQFRPSSFAAQPAERRGLARDEVRLLVGTPDGIEHTHFHDLPAYLRAGDVLVVNTSATVAAELDASLDGHPVVVHVAHHLAGGDVAIEVRTAPVAERAILTCSPGDVIALEQGSLTLTEPWPTGRPSSPTGVGNRLWRARVRGDLDQALTTHGRPIAYGYLDQRYPLADYQTVFGVRPGSAEMASAARPFTHSLVTRLVTAGVQFAPVTLHTGVSSQEAGEAPGPEWFEVPANSARVVNAARAEGRRIIAVGTTATRAIESSVRGTHAAQGQGWTDRLITPSDPAVVINGLITGWHDPMASHLLLVEAIAGPALTQAAYAAAESEHYLWHEFGDSALLLPR